MFKSPFLERLVASVRITNHDCNSLSEGVSQPPTVLESRMTIFVIRNSWLAIHDWRLAFRPSKDVHPTGTPRELVIVIAWQLRMLVIERSGFHAIKSMLWCAYNNHESWIIRDSWLMRTVEIILLNRESWMTHVVIILVVIILVQSWT